MDKIKKNNKGFTLVELIVVVAILAVITVVVAPQYLEYVEKSRIGTDENTIGEVAHVAEITWVEKKAGDDSFGTSEITVNVKVEGDGTFTIESTETAATGKTKVDAEISKVIKESQYTFKSKHYKGIVGTEKGTGTTVPITLNTNGVASWKKADGTVMGGIN